MTFLHPGDVVFGTTDDELETILGSCVAVILTDPRRTIGVMCHVVTASSGLSRKPNLPLTAYADLAFECMCKGLLERGVVPRLCDAYVFGGGNMFPQLERPPRVGEDNVHWMLEALDEMGAQLVATDLGGVGYRKLHWVVGKGAPKVTWVPIEQVRPQ